MISISKATMIDIDMIDIDATGSELETFEGDASLVSEVARRRTFAIISTRTPAKRP